VSFPRLVAHKPSQVQDGIRARSVVLGCLGLLAGLLFCLRGPLRALTDSSDFARIYAFARAWLLASSPYDAPQVYAAYISGHGQAGLISFEPRELCAVYPPTTFPLLVPLTLLGWPAAKLAFLVASLTGFILGIAVLFRLYGTTVTRDRLLTCVALTLAFGPTHTALAKGQPAVLVFALLSFALFAVYQERYTGAALAASAATALKPQLVLPVLLYCIFRAPRRSWLVFVAAFILISIVAVLRLGPPSGWLDQWLSNIRIASTPGGILDPGPTNPASYQLIDAGVLLGFILPHRGATVVAVGLGIVLCGLSIVALRLPRRDLDPVILWLLVAADLALLYHRYYDALLLLLPFIALMLQPEGLRTHERWVAGICLLLLAVPIAPIVNSFGGTYPALKEAAWFSYGALRVQNLAVTVLMVPPLSALLRAWWEGRQQRARNVCNAKS